MNRFLGVCPRITTAKWERVEVLHNRHTFAWSGKRPFSGVLRCIYCMHTAACFAPPFQPENLPALGLIDRLQLRG